MTYAAVYNKVLQGSIAINVADLSCGVGMYVEVTTPCFLQGAAKK